MKASVLVGCVAALAVAQHAWCDPGPGAAMAYADARAEAVPLYEGPAPGGGSNPIPEQWFGDDATSLAVRNVSVPTLRPVLPLPAQATGAGVIIVPGGALLAVSMGNQGMEVAKALASRGIAAFVLKYRTERTPPELAAFAQLLQARRKELTKTGGVGRLPGEGAALADAQQAIRLVHARAQQWIVDPRRLGVLGFSAGAVAALALVLANAPDARPAFAGLVSG